jgi:hypothetical protein
MAWSGDAMTSGVVTHGDRPPTISLLVPSQDLSPKRVTLGCVTNVMDGRAAPTPTMRASTSSGYKVRVVKKRRRRRRRRRTLMTMMLIMVTM